MFITYVFVLFYQKAYSFQFIFQIKQIFLNLKNLSIEKIFQHSKCNLHVSNTDIFNFNLDKGQVKFQKFF